MNADDENRFGTVCISDGRAISFWFKSILSGEVGREKKSGGGDGLGVTRPGMLE